MSRGVLLALALLLGQDKKDPPKSPLPKIAFAQPFLVIPGKPVKLTLRGLNLDQTSEVKVSETGTVVIKSKGKAEVPKEQDAAVYGDTKVEIELTLPVEAVKVSLQIVNAAGTTEPYALEVAAADAVVAEKEPNGGFAQAQPLESGKGIQGAVSQANDVDCFRIDGKKGEIWVFEVVAQQRGVPLDALLTLHDAGGRIVASSDDVSGSRDPRLQVTLAADGVYTLVLIDAHNGGGATHVYFLRARRQI